MIRIDCLDMSRIDRSGYETLYRQAALERRRRADQCRKWEDQVRCVAADALLRRAVARMLGCVEFAVEKGEWGKPRLADDPAFHYNLSHSGRWVVIAYGNSPVGIDVETTRSNAPVERLSRRYFSASEQAYVDGDRARFFELWTAKESYLKYLGTGLTRSVDSFCVLSGDLDVHFFRETLEDAFLTLCTREQKYRLSLLSSADLGL